jgi:Flp pilus assembly protein TadD
LTISVVGKQMHRLQNLHRQNPADLDHAYATCLQMVRRQPDESHPHKLLALADWLRGDGDRALGRIRVALALRPDDSDALSHQAQMLASRGAVGECLALFHRALTLRPWDAELLYRMGVALAEIGETGGAAGAYLLAVVCRPDHNEALNNLGVSAKDLGQFERAAVLFRRSVAVQPGYAPPHNNLGLSLVALGSVGEGDSQYRRALALEPDHADAANNYGVVANLEGDFAKAARWCLRALRLRPDYPAAFNNLGNALKDLGALDGAITAYDEAIRLGGSADHRHNKALAALAAGRLREGWALYEERWSSHQLRGGVRAFAKPRWNGAPGTGTLLFHAEQGFGDSLQFCRYAPLAAARGWRVVLEVPRPLVRLMTSLAGVERVVASGDPLPEFDVQCPMMSLPFAFGTELGSIPAAAAYLAPDAADIRRWDDRLAALDRGLRVGLVWAGNSRRHSTDLVAADRRRSIAPALLAPLAGLEGVNLVSLQKDGQAPFALHDWMAQCADFADTAALIAGLDLVIGVDTAVIHLAAAIGKPVWLLNRFDSCWRWLRAGETTPWYPAMRIFRQPRPGAWEPVIQAVAQELKDVIPLRAGSLDPAATAGCG